MIEQIEQHKVGCDSDYMIKAQDYADDWENNISVKTIKATESAATVSVTLGVAKESARKLSISLSRENQLWKIRKVLEVEAQHQAADCASAAHVK